MDNLRYPEGCMAVVHSRAKDALHRQISIVHVKCKLFRKKELTSVEGSRRASGAHGSRAPIGECTARANWLVHSPKRDADRFNGSAAGVP